MQYKISFGQKLALAFGLTFALFIGSDVIADACTSFCVRNGERVVVGKNYDWNIGDGLVMTNKRGMSKTSAIEAKNNPAAWVSRFGSLTFNQYGRDNPTGGVNEAGLVVELMWLDEARYPPPNGQPTLGVLEWIQYQLDNFATVAEVVDNGAALRINSSIKLHYLVCDRLGDCASIEFLNGNFVPHTGPAMPAQTLTNDTYQSSLAYLSSFLGFGGNRALPNSSSSLDRFVRASALNKQFAETGNPADAITHAFATLKNVAQGSHTQWNIVYDLNAMRVHFRTRANDNIKFIDMAALNWACEAPVQVLTIDHPTPGDIAPSLKAYSYEANRDLIGRSYKGTSFLAAVPASEMDVDARYPEKATCVGDAAIATRPAPAPKASPAPAAPAALPEPVLIVLGIGGLGLLGFVGWKVLNRMVQ